MQKLQREKEKLLSELHERGVIGFCVPDGSGVKREVGRQNNLKIQYAKMRERLEEMREGLQQRESNHLKEKQLMNMRLERA